ncbi:MAG: phosphomethylpyrimidine synthase ThiC, partial [Gemmatimonadales bacterium]
MFIEGKGDIRVPMREITLSGGEPPLRVYDTSGPQETAVRDGLPALRSSWVLGRNVEEVAHRAPGAATGPRAAVIPESLRRPAHRGRGAVTQLHYARQGEITPE